VGARRLVLRVIEECGYLGFFVGTWFSHRAVPEDGPAEELRRGLDSLTALMIEAGTWGAEEGEGGEEEDWDEEGSDERGEGGEGGSPLRRMAGSLSGIRVSECRVSEGRVSSASDRFSFEESLLF
jgi:hypothetical protein